MTGLIIVWGRGGDLASCLPTHGRGEATLEDAHRAGCPWISRTVYPAPHPALPPSVGYEWVGPRDGWFEVRTSSDGPDVEGWGLVLGGEGP